MTQDAHNWQLLQDLFHLAEATPEPDRERVLAERCADVELRRRAMEIFTASSIEDGVEPPASEPTHLQSLTGKIGPYTLLKQIGRASCRERV